MGTSATGSESNVRLPRRLIWAITVVCVAPLILNILGFDFGTPRQPLDANEAAGMSKHELADAMHYTLSGSFTHTILEWSAFCAAIFTAILAFLHFSIKRDIVTPIVGMALFFAGSMDAFHTLAADRLIEAVADNRDLIPFTWAISRLFNALIMIVGVGMFLVRGTEVQKKGMGFVISVSIVFGVISYAIIHICATSDWLPRTMYPDSLITRPYDVAPLVLFIFAWLFVYRPFYAKYPGFFSHALVISVIPEAATQMHMAFGSTALFDNHFNISHFLKIIAYVVPFSGLALDYIFTYREEERLVSNLETEIVERKRVEKEISGIAKFPEENPNPVMRVDGKSRIMYANRSGLELLDIWGRGIGGRLPDNFLKLVPAVLDSGSEKVVEPRYGEKIFSILFVPITDEGYVNLYVKEITIQKQAEEALKKSYGELEQKVMERTAELTAANDLLKGEVLERNRTEETLRVTLEETEQLVAAMPLILIGMDEELRIIKWNLAAETIFGIPSADVLGREISASGIDWNWDEVSRRITVCRDTREEVGGADVRYMRRNGSEGFLQITLAPITTGNEHSRGLILADEVTERRLLEMQLSQAQKLESIGQLAAGIAHEINTPTQYVGDNIHFFEEAFVDINKLLGKYGEITKACKTGGPTGELIGEVEKISDDTDIDYLREEIPRAIKQSLDGVKRVTGIVLAMKEFSHLGAEEKIPVDINRSIESTITVARNEWKYVADLDTDLDRSLPPVTCLAGELNQALLNIMVNAAHSIADALGSGSSEKGTITVTTRRSGAFVEIRISDTGTGIPESIRPKIFDPFFTTKEVGKGTGQGLAIAHSIVVDRHGGAISFKTKKGEGTTFIIRLPIMAVPVREEAE